MLTGMLGRSISLSLVCTLLPSPPCTLGPAMSPAMPPAATLGCRHEVGGAEGEEGMGRGRRDRLALLLALA